MAKYDQNSGDPFGGQQGPKDVYIFMSLFYAKATERDWNETRVKKGVYVLSWLF